MHFFNWNKHIGEVKTQLTGQYKHFIFSIVLGIWRITGKLIIFTLYCIFSVIKLFHFDRFRDQPLLYLIFICMWSLPSFIFIECMYILFLFYTGSPRSTGTARRKGLYSLPFISVFSTKTTLWIQLVLNPGAIDPESNALTLRPRILYPALVIIRHRDIIVIIRTCNNSAPYRCHAKIDWLLIMVLSFFCYLVNNFLGRFWFIWANKLQEIWRRSWTNQSESYQKGVSALISELAESKRKFIKQNLSYTKPM